MANLISISYIAFLFLAFIVNAIYIRNKKPLLKKSFFNLKISKKCAFKTSVSTFFAGDNVALFLAKNNQTCFIFNENIGINLHFCEENFAKIYAKSEMFKTCFIEREMPVNQCKLCVKFDNSGVHSTVHSKVKQNIRIVFFKPNFVAIKKVQTKGGFYIVLGNQKFGFFLVGAKAKLFTNLNSFGFLVEVDDNSNFSILYQNFSLKSTCTRLSKNLYKYYFGMPNLSNHLIPNFNSLFFANQPLKTKAAKQFLTNQNFEVKIEGCLQQDFYIKNNFENFECAIKQQSYVISLTKMGFSKFVKVYKRANLVTIFDVLTKLKISLKFDAFIKSATCFCFWGDVRLFVNLQQQSGFKCFCFNCDLANLCKSLKIEWTNEMLYDHKKPYDFSLASIFNLFNKSILMGQIAFDFSFLKKLDCFMFGVLEQAVLSNLILSIATVFRHFKILKNNVLSKFVLKNASKICLSENEFSFLFLKKLKPFLLNLGTRNKIEKHLSKYAIKNFYTFEGVFCNVLGINVIMQEKKCLINFCPQTKIGLSLQCNINGKTLKLQFFKEGFYKVNGNKFFGNTTTLI